MAQIFGIIRIEIDTDKPINKEQYNKFKDKLNNLVEDWEMTVYDAALYSGFEADCMHPVMLASLDCDFDEEKE